MGTGFVSKETVTAGIFPQVEEQRWVKDPEDLYPHSPFLLKQAPLSPVQIKRSSDLSWAHADVIIF